MIKRVKTPVEPSPPSYDNTKEHATDPSGSAVVEDENGNANHLVAGGGGIGGGGDGVSSVNNTNDPDDEEIVANEAKLGALVYFPMIAMVLTSCLADIHNRNRSMHDEPNMLEGLVGDCPVQDPKSIWWLMMAAYLLVVLSIGFLCRAMLSGFRFRLCVGRTSLPAKTAVTHPQQNRRFRRLGVATTCRLCLLGIYIGWFNYESCMGSTPYLKKKSAQIFLTCMVLSFSGTTLTKPILVSSSSAATTPPTLPRWPLFLIQMMVYLPYTDAGYWKWFNEWKPETMRMILADHYILFQRPLAKILLDGPFFFIRALHAGTIVFECAGWLLVYFGYSRVAAMVAFSFHLGIYLTMKINYLLVWTPIFVFFFVTSTTNSKRFRAFAKRLMRSDEKSVVWLVWLPTMFSSIRIGIAKDEEEYSRLCSNDENESINGYYSSESSSKSSKQHLSTTPQPQGGCLGRFRWLLLQRRLHKYHKFWNILAPIVFGCTLTYKALHPPSTGSFFPEIPESIVGSHESLGYRAYYEAGIMVNHPFYAWSMFSEASWNKPANRVVTSVNYRKKHEESLSKQGIRKELPGASSAKESSSPKAPSYIYRKERWIPDRVHEEYFFMAFLSRRGHDELDKELELLDPNAKENETGSKGTVTICQVMLCLSKRFMLFEREKRNGEVEYTLLPPTYGGLRRNTPKVRNGPWDIVSIEIGYEEYSHPSQKSSHASQHGSYKETPHQATYSDEHDLLTLKKETETWCVLDLNANIEESTASSDDSKRYDASSCDSILGDFAQSRDNFDKDPEKWSEYLGKRKKKVEEKKNPYRLVAVTRRSLRKVHDQFPDSKRCVLGTMLVAMAYRLASWQLGLSIAFS